MDRCRAPSDGFARPVIAGGEWSGGLIGEASRDRACRVSFARDKRTGKYVVRWRSDGRHRSKSFTYQRDAERWDREQKRSRELGLSFDPLRGSETLAEVVEGWWSAHVVKLEENTRRGYRIVWTRHIRPSLGGVTIRSLTAGRVDAFRQALEEAGVGPPTVAKALAIVSGACRFAVLRGLIDANPVRDVRKPKPRRQRFVGVLAPCRVERIRVELLTAGRIRDAVLVSTLAYAGLRPGEARAMRWSDVRSGSLLVERAVAGRAVKATKNERLRAVRLLAALAEDLAMWREFSPFAGDEDFVFPAGSAGHLGLRLAKLAQARLRSGGGFRWHRDRTTIRLAALVRLPSNPREKIAGRCRGSARRCCCDRRIYLHACFCRGRRVGARVGSRRDRGGSRGARCTSVVRRGRCGR